MDQDYRGDVKVIAMNLGDKVLEVNIGMRIAQLVLINADSTVPVWGEEADNTARGSSGFGSTGLTDVLSRQSSAAVLRKEGNK